MRAGAVLLAFAIACGGQGSGTTSAPVRAEGGEPWQGSLSPRPAGAQIIVAEVDGEPIWDVDVARYAAAHGLDARSAALELVDAHLLARAALARGLADDPEVAELRKHERVRALLATSFEPGFDGPEDIPRAEVDRAWEDKRVQYYFDHARYHQVAWVRLKIKRTADPAKDARARAEAEELRAYLVAKAPKSADAFQKAALKWAKPRGHKLGGGRHPATTGLDTDPDFARLAFSIDQVGQISAVGRTPWGWDIVYLYEIIPEVRKNRDEADLELRQRLFETARQGAFLRFVEGLLAGHRVTRHDERLDAITISADDALP